MARLLGTASSHGMTSRMAPPTLDYTGGTFLLKMPFTNSSGFSDQSSNSFSFTQEGSVSISGGGKWGTGALYIPNNGSTSSGSMNRLYRSSTFWNNILSGGNSPTTSFYTSAWVYPTQTVSSFQTYFYGADEAGVPNGCYMAYYPNQQAGVGWQDYVSSNTNDVPINTWTHLLWSFRHTDKQHNFYVNGVRKAQVTQRIYYAGSQTRFHIGIRDSNINVTQVTFYMNDLVIKTGVTVDNEFTAPAALT
jgi:hypothetical protein